MDCVAMLRWFTGSSRLSMTNFHLARGMVVGGAESRGGMGLRMVSPIMWHPEIPMQCIFMIFSLFDLYPMFGQTQEFQNTVTWYLSVMSQSL